MRNHIRSLVIALMAGSLFAGCGRPASSSARTTTTPLTSPSTAAPALANDLLSLSDLPSGWSVDDYNNAELPAPNCYGDLSTVSGGTTATATRKFYQGIDLSSLLEEEILQFNDESDAAQAVGGFQKAMTACGGRVTFSQGSYTFSGTLAPISLANLGGQAVAFQMLVSTGSGSDQLTIGSDFVLIQHRGYVVLIADGGQGVPETAQVVSIAEKAVQKIQAHQL